MQVIGQSEAGQRSFELQDCANHLHSKLVQLAQQHNLLGHSSAAGSDMLQADTPESRSADGAEGSSSAADATATRRAQAKARQVMYHSSGAQVGVVMPKTVQSQGMP